MVTNASLNYDLPEKEVLFNIQCHPVSLFIVSFQIICGIVGNILNFYLFSKVFPKSVAYFYLKSLTVSDFFATFFLIPQYILKCQYGRRNICDIEAMRRIILITSLNTFYAISNLTTLILSIERFLALSDPIKWRIRSTNFKKRYFILAAVWCIPILGHVPTLYLSIDWYYFATDNASFTGNMKCLSEIHRNETILLAFNKWIIEILFKIGPVMFMIFFLILIIFKVRQHTKTHIEKLNNSILQPHMLRREKRLTTMLLVLVTINIVCVFPSAAAMIMGSSFINAHKIFYYTFIATTDLIENFNYAISFIVYFICLETFRNHFIAFCYPDNLRKVSLASSTSQISVYDKEKRVSI